MADPSLLSLALPAARGPYPLPAKHERPFVTRQGDCNRVRVDGTRVAAHAACPARIGIDVLDAERTLDGLLLTGAALKQNSGRLQLGLVYRRGGNVRLGGGAP